MGAAPDKGKKVRLVHANQIISTWERNRAMLSYSGNVLRKGVAGGEEGAGFVMLHLFRPSVNGASTASI